MAHHQNSFNCVNNMAITIIVPYTHNFALNMSLHEQQNKDVKGLSLVKIITCLTHVFRGQLHFSSKNR